MVAQAPPSVQSFQTAKPARPRPAAKSAGVANGRRYFI